MAHAIKNNALAVFIITIISALVFVPFIGNSPLFDWDEINFAECAREMIVSGNYSQVQLNYQPFWEKPPFFIWLQALSMNLFGVKEFAARFPNAMCSIASFIAIYLIGKKFHSVRFGIIWCLLYAASLLPHFYFKSGIIDPWFNLFTFLSMYNCFRFFNNPKGKSELTNALLAGFFLGLAVLTKGPAAIVVCMFTILSFVLWSRNFKLLYCRLFFVFVITTTFVSGSWFLVEWLKGNQQIITEFINYQVRLFETGDSGHGGPFLYHFIVLLAGCFPSSLIFILSYTKYNELSSNQKNFRRMMLCLFWVVLLLFSIVKTKIIHYSSLCYYPLTFIAAVGIIQGIGALKPGLAFKILFWFIAVAFTIAFLLIGFTDRLKGALITSGLIKDAFVVTNLEANGNWTGFESGTAIVILTASILIYLAITRNNLKLLYYGLVLNTIFICYAIAVIVPKIERYTQHAVIEFYRQKAKEHCYVETHGFKSYAQLFYTNRKPNDYINPDQVKYIKNNLDIMEKEGHSRFSSYATCNRFWMEFGNIDRPAYIVIKTIEENDIKNTPGLVKLYQENGFSFFKREITKPVK